MKKRKSKYTEYLEKFFQLYGPVHFESRLLKQSGSFFDDYLLSDKLNLKHFVDLIKLKFFTITSENGSKIISNIEAPTPLELTSVFLSEQNFYSHNTALYLHNLIDQRPEEIFISHEVKGRKSSHSDSYDDFKISLAFMKEARHTKIYDKIQGIKIYKVLKVDTELFDLADLNPNLNLGSKKIQKMSGINRTLIDCMISPNYSGGPLTIIHSLKNADIDLITMKRYYDLNNFYYPFWQRIGLYLEIAKGKDVGKEWNSLFNIPKKEFYISNGFNTKWEKNSKWLIWHPKGVLK